MSLLDTLADAHCQPRRGAEHRLSDTRRDEGLAALAGWSLDASGNIMQRQFDFDDYHRTMAFVNALAFIAHREDHHPDLEVGYNRCVVHFSTHDVGGLSENDLICAAKAQRFYADANR